MIIIFKHYRQIFNVETPRTSTNAQIFSWNNWNFQLGAFQRIDLGKALFLILESLQNSHGWTATAFTCTELRWPASQQVQLKLQHETCAPLLFIIYSKKYAFAHWIKSADISLYNVIRALLLKCWGCWAKCIWGDFAPPSQCTTYVRFITSWAWWCK